MVDLEKVGRGLIAMGAVLADITIVLDGKEGGVAPTTETTTVESAETSEASKMKIPELKKALLAKGFKEDDFKGLKKAELVQMLEQGIPLQAEEPPVETSKEEEITEDMFDQPAAPKTEVLEPVDEATLRSKMVEHAKKFDKEKTFSILAKFDGATAIAMLSDNQRAECYAMIEADLG